jgi:putative methionine-R-sulfoxide reductase with GAF domain
MKLLKFFRSLGLGVKLNVVVVLALGTLLAIVLTVMANGLRDYTLRTGQHRVGQEAKVVQHRFEEAEQALLADAKTLLYAAGLIEAVENGDAIAVNTAVAVGAAPLGFDDIDVVDIDGARITTITEPGEAYDAAQEDALLTLALIGIDTTGVIIEEEEEVELHLAAAVTLRDSTGNVAGALLTRRQVDDEFLADINFWRDQVHLVILHEGQCGAQHVEHMDHSQTTREHEQAPTRRIPVKINDLLDQTAIEGALGGQTVISDDLLFSEDGVPHTMAHTPLTVGGDTPAVIGILFNLNELSTFQRQLTISLAVIFVLVALAVAGALTLFTWRTITVPIGKLESVAAQVTAGDLDARAAIKSRDEIGTLADGFNYMTAQLQETLEGLEGRVAERTRALQVSAEISRRLSTILEQEQLVAAVVEQLQQAFDYYHVHIYLVDETSGDLVLAGGTGEVGQGLVASGHRIPQGKGLVGRAADTNAVVLVPDVSQEEDWLPNELLPDTQSEIAVPVSMGERVLGVLDVQQDVVDGLGQSDAELLASIANQVATALQNTRLFAGAQKRAAHEVLVNLITQRIQSTNTVESAMQIAIRELGRALNAQETSVRLRAATGTGNGRDAQR